MGFVENLVF